jgi:hypothetical protein
MSLHLVAFQNYHPRLSLQSEPLAVVCRVNLLCVTLVVCCDNLLCLTLLICWVNFSLCDSCIVSWENLTFCDSCRVSLSKLGPVWLLYSLLSELSSLWPLQAAVWTFSDCLLFWVKLLCVTLVVCYMILPYGPCSTLWPFNLLWWTK